MSDCWMDWNPKARKPHRCEVCNHTIPKGTVYHKQSGISDGDPYTWIAHEDCAQLYWKYNKDININTFERYEMYEPGDADIEDLQHYRGYFPHVVCRFELTQQKREIHND